MSENQKSEQHLNEKTDWKKYFDYQSIVKNVPFMLFLSALAILYIYNGHYADKLIRKIGKAERNVRELEYEYKTIKSEVIFRSKPTEMIKAMEPMGLKELSEPPQVIFDTMPAKKD